MIRFCRFCRVATFFAAWLARGSIVFAADPYQPSGELTALWWMVGSVGDMSETSLADIKIDNLDGTTSTAAEMGVNAARVRVVGVDGGYLSRVYNDTDVKPPEIWILPKPYDPVWVPTASLADVTQFSPGSPEVFFVIELGNWDADNDKWTFKAESEQASYDSLTANMTHSWNNGSPVLDGTVPWNPTYYSVPEPSGGLLVLLGAAGLLLRRRRKFRA